MDWSVDGQTPAFLAATRMISLDDGIVDAIRTRLGLKSGMRVLDVGCGSGEYCFRLGSAVQGVEFTGIELDAGFVAFAEKRAAGEVGYPYEQPNPANDYRFICGNGLDLPFGDATFDLVVSHTYLTAVPDWACALAEMCRVCKPGGTVSSITSLTDDFYGSGEIALFTNLLGPEDAELLRRVDKAKEMAFPRMDLVGGIAPRRVPVSFEWMGLENVNCTPLAHFFCLSDSAVSQDRKRRYVELLRTMELERMERLKEHPDARCMLTQDEWDEYGRLVERRCDELEGQGANREWSWYGNASLLVCGTVPRDAPLQRWKSFADASREARRTLEACASAGLRIDVETRQIGPGRCVAVRLLDAGRELSSAAGFDEPQAIVEACGKLVATADGAEASPQVWSALDERACALGEQERRCMQREALLAEDEAALASTLRPLPDAFAFAIPDMWETVSEAALSGVAVRFEAAGFGEELVCVSCEAHAGELSARAFACHPDFARAAQRAFARACEKVLQAESAK